MSANKDKSTDEHTTAAEIGNANADPASMPGAAAGASCADAVAEKSATTKKTTKALNELMFAIADRLYINRERERESDGFYREKNPKEL
ncbi:unnamed protein product [Camellia sinensis]